MIRTFNIPTIVKVGYPSEFELKKTIPFTMNLRWIKTTFHRDEEGYLYLTVLPDICEGVDVAVLADIEFESVIPRGTEVTVNGLYTGRYTREMFPDYPLQLSMVLIGEEMMNRGTI